MDHPEGAAEGSKPHCDWYGELNEYRNVLYHRGWRGMFGSYYPRDFKGRKGISGTADTLVVPDRKSIANKAKPHQWTYKDGTRLEDVVERCMEGLRQLIDSICIDLWGWQNPKPGTEAQPPNILVRVPSPLLYPDKSGTLYLPFFTTVEGAEMFRRVNYDFRAELERLPRAGSQPASFMFSIGRLERLPRRCVVRLIVDPVAGVGAVSGSMFQDIELPADARELMEPRCITSDATNSEALFCWVGVPP
ncbi:MAG: hypothetical protein IPG04_05335 [Polyangiaceae bacterium]|nr:hypothetical protein [Polyangiaceae bacterium]